MHSIPVCAAERKLGDLEEGERRSKKDKKKPMTLDYMIFNEVRVA
jgi:hypothetical protein